MQLAKCHPQRKYYALDQCRSCYEATLKLKNPEFAKRQRDNKSYWWKLHPDKRKEYHATRKARGRKPDEGRNAHLLRVYGITSADYDLILAKQNYACALCFRKPGRIRLHVDHDHQTKLVRGLLCHQCN